MSMAAPAEFPLSPPQGAGGVPRDRPHLTVVIATSADGKLADGTGARGRFGSKADRAALESHVAAADGVLMGGATLRAEGTAMRVIDPAKVQGRCDRGLPPQPVQIIATRRVDFDPALPFFRQAVPRWLLTDAPGADRWRDRPEFDRAIAAPTTAAGLDWTCALPMLRQRGIERLAVLGGGRLIGALLLLDAIDELHLTLCPLLIGGDRAPTAADGPGLPLAAARRLDLVSVQQIDEEVFLSYRRSRNSP
ncbi:MAG: dihydrofolate reductase family protein [Cyanophyceae cyanobacterium]